MSGLAGGIARLKAQDTVRAERRLAVGKLDSSRLAPNLPNLGGDILSRVNQYQTMMGMGSPKEKQELQDRMRSGAVEQFQDIGTKAQMNQLVSLMGGVVLGTNARGGGQ